MVVLRFSRQAPSDAQLLMFFTIIGGLKNKHRQMPPFARHLLIILSKVPSSLVRRPPNLYAWAMSQSVSISRLVLVFPRQADGGCC